MTALFDTLLAWLTGELSPTARVLTALGPALLATAFFLLGLAVFAVRCAVRGMPRDAETEKRGDSLLVGFFLRHYYFWLTAPAARLLLRSGLPANAVTALSGLFGIAAGVAVAGGRFALGGWLFLFAGMLDAADGRLARARGEANPQGSALDSVLDRYTDSAILVGLGWYYRDSWVLLPVLLALVGTSLVPYVRAKGESLGIQLRGGVMQRLERVLFLGATTALSPILEVILAPDDPRPRHWLAVGGIVLVAALANVTAATRLRDLLRALRPAGGPQHKRKFRAELALNSIAGAVATAVDFAVVVALVQTFGLKASVATLVGAAVGALTNYSFNRFVTYRSRSAVAPQMARYALVSGSSALINAGGVALLAFHPALDYRFAWWLVRGAVWLGWNFPLQRSYVFAPSREEPRAA